MIVFFTSHGTQQLQEGISQKRYSEANTRKYVKRIMIHFNNSSQQGASLLTKKGAPLLQG
jgi:hypothetical protein